MPFTNDTTALDAILGLFKTGWDTAYAPGPAPFVVYPDQAEDTPPDGSPWVKVLFQIRNVPQVTIAPPGSRRFRNFAKLIFEVRTPFGGGLTTNQAMTDTIGSILEGQTTAPDAVTFREFVPTNIGKDGVWQLTKVVVSLEYDRFR